METVLAPPAPELPLVTIKSCFPSAFASKIETFSACSTTCFSTLVKLLVENVLVVLLFFQIYNADPVKDVLSWILIKSKSPSLSKSLKVPDAYTSLLFLEAARTYSPTPQ